MGPVPPSAPRIRRRCRGRRSVGLPSRRWRWRRARLVLNGKRRQASQAGVPRWRRLGPRRFPRRPALRKRRTPDQATEIDRRRRRGRRIHLWRWRSRFRRRLRWRWWVAVGHGRSQAQKHSAEHTDDWHAGQSPHHARPRDNQSHPYARIPPMVSQARSRTMRRCALSDHWAASRPSSTSTSLATGGRC